MLVIIRSTTACNLRCKYCSTPQIGQRADLTPGDCELLAQKIPALLHGKETITWLWHGGEPTLLEPEQFSQMQTVLDKVQEQGIATRCTMQTNGYALTPGWLEVLKRHNVQIGLSLDGPQNLHDSARLGADGKPTYEKVLANCNKMLEHGLAVALLCTLCPEHLGHEEEMLAWIEEMGLPIRLNPLLELGRADSGLAGRDYFAFLKNFFVLSLQKGSKIPIQPLQGMVEACMGIREISECSYSGTCGERIFSYGPGGVVGPCNRSNLVYGALADSSLLELWEGGEWSRRRNRVREMAKNRCGQCPIWSKCHGGCPQIQGNEPVEADCVARKDFFAWLETEGLDCLRQALLQRRDIIREKLALLAAAKADLNSKIQEISRHV